MVTAASLFFSALAALAWVSCRENHDQRSEISSEPTDVAVSSRAADVVSRAGEVDPDVQTPPEVDAAVVPGSGSATRDASADGVRRCARDTKDACQPGVAGSTCLEGLNGLTCDHLQCGFHLDRLDTWIMCDFFAALCCPNDQWCDRGVCKPPIR